MSGKKYITREDAVNVLWEHGYHIKLNYLNWLCSRAQNQGPPAVGRWGSRSMYTVEDVLAWAESRMRRQSQSQETAA
jgi:hypothetical protein